MNQSSAHPALDWLFRLGFASIFFINALVAWLSPTDFLALTNESPAFLLNLLGPNALLMSITLNDVLLGLAVLSGQARHWVYAWAGAWFLVITYLKIVHLFF